MIKILYYRDANEGRTYDEPYKQNTVHAKEFRTEAEYASWLNDFPEVTVSKIEGLCGRQEKATVEDSDAGLSF